MKPYLELMQRILDEGVEKKDRTGTGTISIFGAQMRFDLSKGFPLATTKKCHLRSIVHELLWFLNGDTNNQYLTDNGVSIWDEWCATEDIVDCTGTMGAVCRWIDCHASAELRNIISRHQSDRKAMQSALSEYMASQKPTPLEMPKTTNADDWIAFVDSLNIGCVAKDIIVYSKRIGDFGPIYGKQWRDWVGPNDEHHDQIANVLRQLREDPDSRRIIISAWNVADLDKMALPPCHAFMQFYTRELTYDERMQWFYDNMSVKYAKGEAILENAVADVRLTTAEQIMEANNVPKRVLSLQLYARSQDYFLGTPFNIASYALLVHWIARCVGMAVGEFVWTGGDIHLYSNHIDQAREQLSRQPRNLPRFIWVSPTVPADPKDIKPTDFDIIGYDPHPGIKAPIAI